MEAVPPHGSKKQSAGPGTDRHSDDEWRIIAERLDLTSRQIDILQAILAGRIKSQAIAHPLGIKSSSVDEQSDRMYTRLDIHSKVELVVRVLAELLNLRCGEDSCP